ncbi:MAG: hypothetical protein ACXW2H_04685, partial [Candidatus Aminicenantales bacterium]
MSNIQRLRVSAITLIFLVAAGPAAWAGDDFVIGGARVKAGSAASGSLVVPPGKDGAATEIPYTVVNGAKSGKV